MTKYKISLVSYINTLPFLYGLKSSNFLCNNAEIFLEYPSKSAKKIIENKADIGLIPVGALVNISKYKIISPYCLGTNKEVKTVVLVSDVPLNKIETILLDYQSVTSVGLVKILSNKYWNINPKWENTKEGYINRIKEKTAGLVIGDRVFELTNNFEYTYDLSLEWFNFTSLPFTFAIWVSKSDLDEFFIKEFNKALLYGLNNIKSSLAENNNHSYDLLYSYLTQNMNYIFDKSKQKSMNLYLDYLNNK